MSDTYHPKHIILKHSTEFSVLTTYDDEKNDGKTNFKAEIVEKGSEEYNKYFSVAEKECFINNESHILLDYYEDETKLKEIFNGFDQLAKNANYCFYDMRKTVLKYLLYKYGENDKYFFWEEVKQNFLKNYYFIDKIEQLIEKAKENQNNGTEKKLNHYYDLTYEVFTDTNFNISNIQQEFEPPESNHCDNKKLLQRFISILIGALNEKKEFQIVENFENLKENIQTQYEKSKYKLYQTIATQLQKFDKLPKDIAKQIYLLSLDEKQEKIVFVDFFKGTENNYEQKTENDNGDKQEQNVNVNTQTIKYKEKWEEIKKNYQEIYDAKDEIINDLFALHFFTEHDFKTKKFLRLPLWKILQLSFSSDKYKNECITYLDTLEKQLKKGGSESSQQNESEKSLLNKMEIILEDDKFDIKIKKYFPINNKNNQKRILFNLPYEDLDSLSELPELQGKDIKDTIPQLFIDLVNDIINKSLKQLTNNVNSNQELYNNIENAKKKVFTDVLRSLDKKSIPKYGNKENQTSISDDFLKFRTISLEPIWYTLPMSLNLSLKQEKTSLPKFLDKITIKPEELSALLLETFKLKEPFFKHHIFMQNLLKIIIQKYIQKSSKTPITKKITKINDFIKERIIKLNLLYKIHDLICLIWSPQIEEAVSEKEKDASEEEKDVSEEDEDNILSDDIISKNFETLMKLVSISDIKNVDDIKKNLPDLIMYSNEFCRRLKLDNSVLFDLQIYYLTVNNKNLPESEIKELITWFNNKDKSFNEKLFPLLEKLIQNNENKNAIKLLELFYLKTKVNTEDNNEETPQKNNNLQKEIIMFLFKQPELYFESIQLYQVIFKDMFELNNLIEKNVQEIILKNLHDSNIVCEQKMHLQFIFIHILEKIFLSEISERKVENFKNYNIKDIMVGDIKDLNDEMIKNKQKNVCIGENFYQLVAIAFLRVYFKIYLEVLKSGQNTSYCSDASDYFNDNQQENIVKIMEYYVLKIIRTKYCKSFREFRSYNFSGDQMLWVSDLKFKGNSETEFEYQFFSFWDDSGDYFNKYKEFNNKIFIPLKKESFRTSKFDEEIKKFFEEEDNIEIFVDVIMNVILCNTWEKDYISKMEYVEFTTWAQPFIENLGDKISENWKNYLLYLSANNNENDQKPGFNKILGSFTKEENENKMTILDLETIFISLKFVLAFIIKKVELPITEKQLEILEETDETKLIKKLNEFIIKSTEYYQKFDNDKCKDLLTSFNEIKDLLRFNNINQIKLFMNFLYYKLKKSDKKLDDQKNLTEIITLAIKDWPNQGSVIKKYYEFVDYKEERIRNVILDERFTEEALFDNKYKDKDSCLEIPVYRYFYYEELPSWKHLINEYLPKIAKEDIKNNYPYIYYFSDGDQDKKYKIYKDYPESDLNPNPEPYPIFSKNIKEIIRNDNGIEYYPFTYSGFKCLDEMAVYYSKSFVFKTKTPNRNLGYMIKYDVQAIENELSAIGKLVVEKTKVSMEEKDYIG